MFRGVGVSSRLMTLDPHLFIEHLMQNLILFGGTRYKHAGTSSKIL